MIGYPRSTSGQSNYNYSFCEQASFLHEGKEKLCPNTISPSSRIQYLENMVKHYYHQQIKQQQTIQYQGKRISQMNFQLKQIRKLVDSECYVESQSKKITENISNVQTQNYPLLNVPFIRSKEIIRNSRRQRQDTLNSNFTSSTKRKGQSSGKVTKMHKKTKKNIVKSPQSSLLTTIIQRRANIQKELKSRISAHFSKSTPKQTFLGNYSTHY